MNKFQKILAQLRVVMTVLFTFLREMFKKESPTRLDLVLDGPANNEEDSELERKKKRHALFFWSSTTAVYTLVIILTWVTLGEKSSAYSIFDYKLVMSWDNLVYQLLLLQILFSIKIVPPGKVAAKVLFGRAFQPMESGPVFIPYFPGEIFQLAMEEGIKKRFEFPAEPEKIYRGDEHQIPQGMYPPIRVTFKGDGKEGVDGKDPLATKRITAEITPVVTMQINDLTLFINRVGSMGEAERQLQDISVSTLTKELSPKSVAATLADLEEAAEPFAKKIEEMTNDWGVRTTAQIKSINFNHSFNKALTSVPEAQFDRESKMLEGEGEGLKEEKFLEGQARGLAFAKDKTGVSAEKLLAAQTAREITSGEKKVVYAGASSGVKDLLAVSEAFPNRG